MKRFLIFRRAGAGVFLLSACAAGATVTGLEAIAAPGGSIFLRWEDVTDSETGFLVERKSGDGAFETVITTPPDNTAYTDTGLLPDTAYTYRVQALVTGDPQASEVSATTLSQWSVPKAEPAMTFTGSDSYSFGFQGGGATYTVEESSDLDTWSPTGSPVYLEESESFELSKSLSAGNRFFRVSTRAYERPTTIGLSEPFQTPPEPDGEVWDVTQFGASPSNISPTNDDAVGIKVAISVAQPGDIIFIPAGTYTLRQELQIPTGLTLRGAGKDQTILVTEGINRAVYVGPRANNIRIEDFAITYLGSTEELAFGVYVGSSRTGLNSYRILIDNLRIEKFSIHGVSLRDSNHVLVQNCEILNATNLGGGGRGYGIALNYPTNNNNWIRHNTIGPVIRHAILVQYFSHNNLIEHNLAVDNSEDAYDLHGEDEYANELRYNTASGGDRDGFGVGNTGSTHDRSGPNNWIHHNTVENAAVSGIEVIQGSDVVYIDENTFSGCRYGIRVHDIGGDHIYIRGNTVQDNNTGISVTSSRWVWMLDNRIEDNTSYGVEIFNDVDDLVDQGNIFSGNAVDYRP
ncbi:hypothetical protein G0Q06_07420 [Puniceicoccales bacterium CK1056]|uniref:Fibronectin type-III domain-containing protein n=1 Tax=Oceanipulchritudo coccoides TaxID=2706888 RepID=A0A6B2M1P9_9BACT|nr:right-handed parallel beta-helix repeat-containing protein [Oceanipulchritudo coccoides]NDV62272.1 hypothetical protein [Oceanipulchritudo coccoides]